MLALVQQAIAGRPAGLPLILLADFDGTLAEFDEDPAAPMLAENQRTWLATLARRPDCFVGLVSGRRIADLRARAPLPDSVYYAGLHGLEIDGPTDAFRHASLETARPDVVALLKRLQAVVQAVEGTRLEDKGASAALHVRGAAPALRDVAIRRADTFAAHWLQSKRLRRLAGNLVVEYVPDAGCDKGHAVSWIAADVARRAGRAGWVVFLGDDITDEDAFRAITCGIGVLVGDRPTAAAHRVASMAEVGRLLRWLAT